MLDFCRMSGGCGLLVYDIDILSSGTSRREELVLPLNAARLGQYTF